MELIVAKNLNEYCDITQKIKFQNKELWFRGMNNASFYLTPSIYRNRRNIGLEYSGKEINGKYYRKSDAIVKSDLSAIDTFIEKYNALYPEKSKDFNLIDYLYIMQHYDIPTRLLDFSTDELIALYFSVSYNNNINQFENLDTEIEDFFQNEGYSQKGSSVHIIDPIFTNKNTNCFANLKDEILRIDNISIDLLSQIDLPICIKHNNKDPRILNQKGVFLLFGRDYRSYEDYYILKSNVKKIFIPNSCRNEIKEELKDKYKISHSFVFPDLKGISLEINEQIETKFESDCNNVFGK